MRPLREPRRPPRPGSTRLSMRARQFQLLPAWSFARNADYTGWMFGIITLASRPFDDTIERVNTCSRDRVLQRLDALARSAGESRSGFIAN